MNKILKVFFFIFLILFISNCKKKKKDNWWWLLFLLNQPTESTQSFSSNQNPNSTPMIEKKLNGIIVMNIYPNTGNPNSADYQAWDKLKNSANSFYIVVIYPPSNLDNIDYDTVINELNTKNAMPIANVDTNYSNESISTVKQKIDNLIQYYSIKGFFINQVPTLIGKYDSSTNTFTSYFNYYQEIYQYIKSKDSNLKVVLNHGSIPDTAYFSIADINVLFLNQQNYLDQFFSNWEGLPWKSLFSYEDFAIIVKNLNPADIDSTIYKAKKNLIFNLYFTDQNDFNVFPSDSFWNSLKNYYGN